MSDLDYLLRAVGETQLPIFGDNLAYIAALTKHGGETFEADVEIVWPCSDRHAIVRVSWSPQPHGLRERQVGHGQEGRAPDGDAAVDLRGDPTWWAIPGGWLTVARTVRRK